MKRVAIYIRVSTDKQAKKGDSLAEQMETLTSYVNDHDDLVLYDSYIDDGVSGQKIKRDGFQRLIGDVKAGKIDLIVFTKLDRWFRSLRHYLNIQATLDKYHVEWEAVAQPFYDTTTPQGRAFAAQGLIFAELEAQSDSDRIKDVFDYKYKRGEVLSGSTPMGFSIVDKHLQPNEDAEKVVCIFEHYDHSNSLADTLRFLVDEYGISMSKENLKRSILKNKKYIGVMRDNEHFCPAIVDRELFDRVQYKLSKNIKASQKRQYIFSGLIVCACCGRRFTSYMSSSRHKGKVYTSRGYRCQYHSYKRCTNRRTITEGVMEKYLLDNIKPMLADYIAEYEIKEKKKVDTRSKRDAILKKISRLKDLYLNELISLDEYKADKERFEVDLCKLEDVPAPKDFSAVRAFLKRDITGMYKGLTDGEKRYFWRSIIKEITIDADRNITVTFL